ncbi:hypothetical protein HFV04_021565 [Pseudomonas sp. BIGb0427]|uniref:hypothetical protein n=1 Tax=Pseudomonas TaxID=286 RepID=UPI0005EB7E43|nr:MULTISPECIES: hypothetical protein [Pseudomonas]KJK19077.1 hypothetical protein UB48_04760 [Pseudomonas sp. 2(2015)]QPG62091.1 hypothetical protein HFV04_021565 [Pseudomonas sp. BIGb0427]UVL26793.1 hypothetical protein LOY30_12700 [Pseudomonas donghuensis]UVL53975.1 hypothetical protein LOY22_13870 [Pseudomonas sp. B21-035]UVL59229.1 hypothetical protein LOY54_14290 [Pseudomonas sp. B21-032]
MHESIFDALEDEAKDEVRQLSAELGWSLEHTAQEYLRAGQSLAIQLQMERMKRPAQVLSLVGHKKALDVG